MATLLLLTLLAIAAAALRLVIGESPAGFVFTVIGIMVAIAYEPIKVKLAHYDARLANRKLLQPLVVMIQKLADRLIYFDLAVLIIACLLVGSTAFSAFVFAVDDLTIKGYIAFPKGDDGFVHLQIYLAGFLPLTLWSFSLAVIALNKGFNAGRLSILKTATTIPVAFSAAIVILVALRGEWTGAENYNLMAKANPDTLPTGAGVMRTMIAVSLGIAFCIVSSLWTWTWSSVGMQLARILRRDNQSGV